MSTSHRTTVDETPNKQTGDYGDTPWRVTDESERDDSLITDDDDDEGELEESEEREEDAE